MKEWVDIVGFSYIGIGIACAIAYGVCVCLWDVWDSYQMLLTILVGCFPWVASGLAGYWAGKWYFSIDQKAKRAKKRENKTKRKGRNREKDTGILR